jgi:peptidoglycan/LPS O-acetylase OafA/YrhL
MYPASTPRVRLLGTSNLDEAYQHSIVISALRSCAALQVLAAHLRGALFPSLRTLPDPAVWYQALAFVTGFSHLAVMVFFVLSGWLVGGSLLNKLGEPQLFASYAIDRLTRLWIVLIPTFVLTLVLGTVAGTVDPERVSFAADDEYSVAAFLGNLFGLQGMEVPRFGINYSLWSLSNETWYYVLFPLLLLPLVGKSKVTRMAGLIAGAIIAYHLLDDILLYFLIWLLGAVFSRIRIDLSRRMRTVLLIGLGSFAVYYRLGGSLGTPLPRTFAEDLLFSVIFACWLSSLQFPADRTSIGNRLAILAGYLAPFSFTLYAVHYPIIHTIKRLDGPLGIRQLSASDPGSLLACGALFVGIVVFAWLFHLPFEAQTHGVRRYLKRLVLGARQMHPQRKTGSSI